MAGSGGLGLDGLLSSTGATKTSHQRWLRFTSSGGSWATTVEHLECWSACMFDVEIVFDMIVVLVNNELMVDATVLNKRNASPDIAKPDT